MLNIRLFGIEMWGCVIVGEGDISINRLWLLQNKEDTSVLIYGKLKYTVKFGTRWIF